MKKKDLWKVRVIAFILAFVISLLAVSFYKEPKISNFEECTEAGNPVMESYPRQCRDGEGNLFVEVINTDVSSEVVNYFYDKFPEKAINLSGGLMPIEGFTPRMYTDFFSGLKKTDFNNVEAIGWIWEYSNSQLIFVDSNDSVITSADGTVNKMGMKSLLENLKQRLNIQLENMPDIDNLIALLSQEPVKLFCPPESRNVESCIEIYQPVCGGDSAEKTTYSNSCFACMDENVLYYTKGVCLS